MQMIQRRRSEQSFHQHNHETLSEHLQRHDDRRRSEHSIDVQVGFGCVAPAANDAGVEQIRSSHDGAGLACMHAMSSQHQLREMPRHRN